MGMSKSIFITRKIPDVGIRMLQEKGYQVDINPEDKILTGAELINFLNKKPYDAVLTLLTDNVQKDIFDAAPNAKIFSNYATGYNNIDIALAKARGVTVANAPAPLASRAVAQHAITFILIFANRIMEADTFVREGKYEGWSPDNFIGMDFTDKVLGLVGAGRIGEQVALYAKSLGMKIIYNDTNRNEHMERECGAEYFPSLRELLPAADFVSLHVPLLPTTTHLINEETLHLMKPTALVINTSRGGVIDEQALEKALKKKVIAGAALDVFEFEPKVSPGLMALPNVILTPHIASASREAREQMAQIAAQNIIDFFEGKPLQNIVNK